MTKNRGRKPLQPDHRREHQVKCQLTESELAQLDEGRPEGTPRGEWLRMKAFSRRLPKAIPEINRQAWEDLARSLANLNQLAKGLN